MQTFYIYQNHATKENADFINKNGWDKSFEKLPAVKAHFDLGFKPDSWKDIFIQYFKPVAKVDLIDVENSTVEKELERVFRASNLCTENYSNFDKAHSLSVGDLVKTNAGDYYLVANFGFKKVL